MLILIEAGSMSVTAWVRHSIPKRWVPFPFVFTTGAVPVGWTIVIGMKFTIEAVVVAELLSTGEPLSVTVRGTRRVPGVA